MEEITQLDGFVSDIGHVIRWMKISEDVPPKWWCITDDEPYDVCVLLNDDAPNEEA